MSRLWVPIDRLEEASGANGPLAHEYLHSHQPATDAEAANWLREAVATAVGISWATKYGRNSGVHPPFYRLSLDLPFHFNDKSSTTEDAGFRSWLYLLDLGERIGSRDRVAYLADDAFLNDRQCGAGGTPAEAMARFYNEPSIEGATFSQIFPEFAARFNNLDGYSGKSSYFHYHKSVQEETFTTGGASSIAEKDYQDSVFPHAAAPLLLKLNIGGADADLLPRDRLMLAEVEITASNHLDDLTLIAEHELAETQHKTTWLMDSSDPPEEMGFYRIVHAPKCWIRGVVLSISRCEQRQCQLR